MTRSVVDLSTRFRIMVLAIAAALVVLGVAMLPSASVDVLPEFSPPYVEVQTEALGLSAEEVEQLITVPLEADLLNGVAWLQSIESRSVQSLSSIVLTFEPGTDPIRARQMVAERLTQAHALPNVSKPPAMLQPLSSSNRLMIVSLDSDELSLMEMSVLARWTIRPRLMGVAGVANVAIWGQRERQLQVLIDPERLRDHGVSLDDVVETAGNALWWSPLSYLEASTPGTGGFIDSPNQRLGVQHVFPINTPDDLARVTIEDSEDPDGERLRLGQVADVVEDHQPLIGDAQVEGEPSLLLVVEKFPEADTLSVTSAVEDALEAMGPGLRGVEIDTTIFRPATFLESAMRNVGLAAAFGLLLMAVAVATLLVSWRAGLVALVVVPSSVILAALVLHVAGTTMNVMVAAGLVAATTVIVDDAVVATTAVLRRRRERPTGRKRRGRRAEASVAPAWRTVLVDAVVAVRTPLTYAGIVVALVAIPLLLIGGVTGAFLPSALAAYLVAVAVSTVVALTVAPALSFVLMRRSALEEGESRLVRRAQAAYGALLARIARYSDTTLAVSGAVTLGVVVLMGVSMVPRVTDADLPAFEERDLLVRWEGPPGTSRDEMNRIIALAADELRDIPGVRRIGGQVGRAIASDRIVSINAGELWLSIDPNADYDATLSFVHNVIDGFPGLETEVTTYPAERIDEIVGGEPDDVVVRIFGQDYAVIDQKAEEIRAAIGRIAGVTSATVEPIVEEPAIQIEVDLEAAGAHGLKAGDVRRAAATMLSGIEVGALFEDQKVFEVVVWGTPDVRRDLTSIAELAIETPDGALVALDDLANIRIAPAPTVIRRDNVQRFVDVTASTSDRDSAAVLADVEAALGRVEFPLETHAEILQLTAEREELRTTLIAVTAAVLVGILLVLQAAFGSWRLAFAVFALLPTAISGGVFAALLLDEVASIGAILGLTSVLALAVRHGILVVDRVRVLERDDPTTPRHDLAHQAARERLAPTVTATFASALTILPFAVAGSRAGLEILGPMALVIIGGVATSTFTNLIVVPSLLMRSGMSPQADDVAIGMEPAPEPRAVGAG